MNETFDLLRITGLNRKRTINKYATFHQRTRSAVIDLLVIIVPMDLFMRFVYPLIFPGVTLDLTGIIILYVVMIVMFFIYSGICWHYWSATPGKMLLRFKVVDAQSEMPLTAQQIYIRLGGYMLCVLSLGIGFFWIICNKKRQGWHDKLAHTVVLIRAKQAPAVVDPSNSPAPSTVE